MYEISDYSNKSIAYRKKILNIILRRFLYKRAYGHSLSKLHHSPILTEKSAGRTLWGQSSAGKSSATRVYLLYSPCDSAVSAADYCILPVIVLYRLQIIVFSL